MDVEPAGKGWAATGGNSEILDLSSPATTLQAGFDKGVPPLISRGSSHTTRLAGKNLRLAALSYGLCLTRIFLGPIVLQKRLPLFFTIALFLRMMNSTYQKSSFGL